MSKYEIGSTWFVDDRRNEDDIKVLTDVVWQNESFALCAVDIATEPFLVDLTNDQVLNGNYDSWVAIRDIGPAIERLRELHEDSVQELAGVMAAGKVGPEWSDYKKTIRQNIASLSAEIVRHCPWDAA